MTAARPLEPRGGGWVFIGPPPGRQYSDGGRWRRAGVLVISTLDNAEYPDRSGIGPQWHLSVSRNGHRPRPKDVARVLRDFRIPEPEEDNHEPGNARHFWCPLDETKRVDCECKDDEVTIVEPDGHTWTNPHDPAECRGCALQRIGKACPLHSGAMTA